MSRPERERDRIDRACWYCGDRLIPNQLHVCDKYPQPLSQCSTCLSKYPRFVNHRCSRVDDLDSYVIDQDIEKKVTAAMAAPNQTAKDR